MKKVTVIAERQLSLAIPGPIIVQKDEIIRIPEEYAEKLIELGDVRMYGGGAEDKALRPAAANKAARELAEEHGVELSLIEGTGRGGRITKTDVKKYLESVGEM